MTPLVISQIALETGMYPAFFLLLWCLSKRCENDGALKFMRWGLDIRTSYNTLDYVVQLDIWAVTAVTWGPLVPVIQPLLLLAVAVSYVMLRIETCHFGCNTLA